MTADPFRILVATGIGDSIWSLLKAQSIAKAHGRDSVELLVAGWEPTEIECRALPLLRRFPFVSSVRFFEMPRTGRGPCLKSGPPTDEKGRFRYIDNGKPSFQLRDEVDFVCIPNGQLEYGVRLEDIMPEYEVDWGMFERMDFPECDKIGKPSLVRPVDASNYVVFFLGAEGANHPKGLGGHNRGALWTGEQWAELGDRLIEEMDTEIVIVGAGYDIGYYENWVRPHIKKSGKWHYRLAEFALMETLAICSQARAVVSYQSGIGIMSHYLNVPTAMWWRPDQNSIHHSVKQCFSNDMAHAWCYPDWKERGNYLPCIYGRETVEDIATWLCASRF